MTLKLSASFMLGVLLVVAVFHLFLILFLYPQNFFTGGNQNACWNTHRNDTFAHRWPENIPEIIYNQSAVNEMLLKAPEKKKVLPPKSQFDFLLRLRKLVLYSVREVNLRIRGQECAQWWANPLSVSEVKEVNVSRGVTQYQLTFEIQPGRIPFRMVVNVSQSLENGGDLRYEPEELVFVDGRRLDALPKSCRAVPPTLRKICLCPEENMGAEVAANEVRKEWEVNDPELNSWPPNLSMMVPDYISFGRMDFYLNSPVRNTEFCGPEINMVLFISTYPNNFKAREAIRETFGNPQFLKEQRVKVLFVFDKVTDKTLQDEIDEESDTHDDIVQGSHDHSYHNLTLRALSMFNWIMTHCRLKASPLPKWFMKTDDDYFINIPLALDVAAVNPNIEVMGVLNCGQPVERDPGKPKFRRSKYYTPRYVHTPEFYPGYISGASWLIRSDILPSLLKASLTVPILPMEDVYMMGVLTREVGIHPRNLRQMTYGRRAGPCETKRTINSNTMNLKDFYIHWEYFRQPSPRDCKLPSRRMKKAIELTNGIMTSCFFAYCRSFCS